MFHSLVELVSVHLFVWDSPLLDMNHFVEQRTHPHSGGRFVLRVQQNLERLFSFSVQIRAAQSTTTTRREFFGAPINRNVWQLASEVSAIPELIQRFRSPLFLPFLWFDH